MVDTVAGGKIRSGVAALDVPLSDISGLAVDPNGNLVVCEWPANVNPAHPARWHHRDLLRNERGGFRPN
jgi:hypothetical protein